MFLFCERQFRYSKRRDIGRSVHHFIVRGICYNLGRGIFQYRNARGLIIYRDSRRDIGDSRRKRKGKRVKRLTADVVAPTETEKGRTVHSCDCGDSYEDSFVDELGFSLKFLCSDVAAGSITGKTEQNVLNGETSEKVVAVPTRVL